MRLHQNLRNILMNGTGEPIDFAVAGLLSLEARTAFRSGGAPRRHTLTGTTTLDFHILLYGALAMRADDFGGRMFNPAESAGLFVVTAPSRDGLLMIPSSDHQVYRPVQQIHCGDGTLRILGFDGVGSLATNKAYTEVLGEQATTPLLLVRYRGGGAGPVSTFVIDTEGPLPEWT